MRSEGENEQRGGRLQLTLIDGKTLESVLRTYQSVSNGFVRRYQHIAQLNSLPFDLSRESLTAKAFSETLSDACLDFLQGRRARRLPPWRRMMRADWRPELNVIAERGETCRRVAYRRRVNDRKMRPTTFFTARFEAYQIE